MPDQALYPVSDAELGLATKQKYPGKYDSLPNDAVGRAMKQAHPEFRKPFRTQAEFQSNLKTFDAMQGPGIRSEGPQGREPGLIDTSGDLYALGSAGLGVGKAGLSIAKDPRGAASVVGAAARGLKQGFAKTPSSKAAGAVATPIGGAIGYSVGKYPGAILGSEAGALAGSQVPRIKAALSEAVKLAKERAKFRMTNVTRYAGEPVDYPAPFGEPIQYRGEPTPYPNPRTSVPAWKGAPEPTPQGLPEVEPISQTRTPSGRATTPAPRAPYAPPPERTPLWKQVEQAVKPSPKAELKPPDITPSEAAPRFEPNAAKREAIARNATLARVLHEGGITAKQAESEMDSEHWKFLAEQLGLKVPAKGQVPEILKQLERLEQAAPIATKPPIPSPAHRLNPPEGPGG